MPATPDELFALLASQGISVSTIDHPPLLTVEDAKTHRGTIEGAHTKNLFLKDRKGRLFLVVLEEDACVDLKTIHQILGASGKVSFGSAELLLEVLGVQPGAVSPFGVINDIEKRVTVVFDQALLASPKLNHHPLVNIKTTTITRDALLEFLNGTGHPPRILSISAPVGSA